jgi:ribosomal protein S27AE
MTSPPARITVECPRCGERYHDFYLPSISLGLGEDWTDEQIRVASSATCPACGHVVELDTLVVSGDVWRLG